jgi:hypothetical protein
MAKLIAINCPCCGNRVSTFTPQQTKLNITYIEAHRIRLRKGQFIIASPDDKDAQWCPRAGTALLENELKALQNA